MTRDELLDFANSLTTELTPPPPPPLTNLRDVDVTVHDVVLNAGERIARVPVTLQEPAKQTMYFKLLTVNDTAKQDSNFRRYEEWVMFHKGDQAKIIDIIILNDFPGKRFALSAASPLGFDGATIPQMVRNKGYIYGPGATTALPTPKVENFSTVLPSLPTGLNLVFQENFGTDFIATDSGQKPDGTGPCWLSRLGHGRQQYNGEIGWYPDPVLNLGTTPWLWEDGKFKLQAEYFPSGVPGAPLTTSGTAQWFYTSPIISTKTLFNTIGVGTYVEARMQAPLIEGTWPAFWLLYNGSNTVGSTYAPQPEIDIFEGFFSDGVGLDKFGTTVHWRTSANTKGQYGVRLQPTEIDTSIPHTWGFWWGEKDWIFYIDGQPFWATPNLAPLTHTAYLKINIAVGGQGGTPVSGSFPVKMPVDWVKIWK